MPFYFIIKYLQATYGPCSDHNKPERNTFNKKTQQNPLEQALNESSETWAQEEWPSEHVSVLKQDFGPHLIYKYFILLHHLTFL